MQKTIGFSEFKADFLAIRPENFSDEGLLVLFNYLEELEADTGTSIEFDVIGLCCEFAEDEPESIAFDFDIDISDCTDDGEIKDRVIDYLCDRGEYVGSTNDTIVYGHF
jgi:hypothetical protein